MHRSYYANLRYWQIWHKSWHGVIHRKLHDIIYYIIATKLEPASLYVVVWPAVDNEKCQTKMAIFTGFSTFIRNSTGTHLSNCLAQVGPGGYHISKPIKWCVYICMYVCMYTDIYTIHLYKHSLCIMLVLQKRAVSSPLRTFNTSLRAPRQLETE